MDNNKPLAYLLALRGGSSLHQQANGVHVNDAPHFGQSLVVLTCSIE
jgi:hypothetical protein